VKTTNEQIMSTLHTLSHLMLVHCIRNFVGVN